MQRRRTRWAAAVAAVLAVLAMPAAGAPAAANGLPGRMAGDQAGSLVPRQETRIRIDSEDLAFALEPDLASARVTATYRMTNPDGAPAETGVAFVLVDSGRGEAPPARVEVDGAPVPHRRLAEAEFFASGDWLAADPALRAALAPRADRWQPSAFLDPVTGQVEQADFYGLGQTHWLLFAVDFPPAGTRTVTVTYTHRPAVHRTRYANHVYQYDYLLSPARYWASFGDLSVTVRLPAAASFASTLPLAADGRRVYRGQFAGLPDADLTFSVMPRRGLIPGVAHTSAYLGLLALLPALAGGGTGWLLGRRWARFRSWVARFLLNLLGSGAISLVINGLLLALILTAWPVQAFQTGYNVLLAVPAALLGALISVIASSISMARAARQAPTS